MSLDLPLHLGTHLLGLAVAAGLLVVARQERREPGLGLGLAVAGALLVAAHLAVGALLAVPEGWPALLRAAGYAALAVAAAGPVGRTAPVVAAVPVLALVPLTPASAAGAAGLAAALAAARGRLDRGRAAVPLAAGVAAWAVGDLLVGRFPVAAAVCSIAGSLGVGTWLLARVGARSLAGRLLGAALAVLLLLTVGLGTASGVVYTTDLQDEQTERLAAVAEARANELADGWTRELETTASLLTGTAVIEAVEAAEGSGDADGQAETMTSLPGVDVAVLLDEAAQPVGVAAPDGLLGRADLTALSGDALVGDALAGSAGRRLLTVGDGRLLALGASPAAPGAASGEPQQDRVVGAVLVGRLVTAPSVISSLAADTAADAAVVVDGRVAATTLSAPAAQDLAQDATGSGSATLAGETRTVASAPLAISGREQRASLALAMPTDSLQQVAASATRSTFLVAALALLATGALTLVVTRRITDPLGRLTGAAERVAAGDLDTRVVVDRDDEVGRLGAAFDEMTGALATREEQLRRAAAEQARLRARLEAVTSSMGEALVATDAEGRITLANPAAERLLGTDEPLVGRPVDEVVAGTTDDGRDLLETLGSGAPASARGALSDRSVVAATAAPLATEEAAGGRVYVLRDVTAEVAADRLRAEIIANVSHELRTPLTPIMGYLELLRGRELPPERVREFAEQGVEAAQRLQRIIEKFIDLADLEAGHLAVDVEPVPVADVVTQAVERWRPELDGRLQRRVRRDVGEIRADPALLGRALDELIENAAKFSEGPVRLLAERDGDGAVRLVVRDRGPGIGADEVERVLADFEQADGSATRRVGGLGLGLSIARRITTRLDAELRLDDAGGRGTDATIRLREVR